MSQILNTATVPIQIHLLPRGKYGKSVLFLETTKTDAVMSSTPVPQNIKMLVTVRTIFNYNRTDQTVMRSRCICLTLSRSQSSSSGLRLPRSLGYYLIKHNFTSRISQPLNHRRLLPAPPEFPPSTPPLLSIFPTLGICFTVSP